MTYLEQIIENKFKEVEQLESLDFYKEKRAMNPRTDIRKIEWNDTLDVIAEIKRKSPSKGELATIENPAELARTYEVGGAVLISVLTDAKFFGAKHDDLEIVRNAIDLPILRKDFIVDEKQIYESYFMGADVILLIVDAVERDALTKMYSIAKSLGLEVLLETSNEEQYEFADKTVNANLIGSNTRDLKTFKEDFDPVKSILEKRNKNIINVWESGITNLGDAKKAYLYGADAVLVGQGLVQNDDPAKFIGDIRRIS